MESAVQKIDNDPQHVIRQLRASSEAYREAAERESAVWGEHFSDPDVIRVRQEDATAGALLRVDRARIGLPEVARLQGLSFQHGLSLACGSGRAERHLMRAGICRSFVGIDIAPDALDEARRAAAEESLDISYQCGDLNDVSLPESAFDLVVTQNCLHHVLELEHLAEEIWKALRPGGYVWIDDFIGETQFQWTDARLAFVNGILSALPEKYRINRLDNMKIGPYVRPRPGTLGSPFEAIRSAEIVPVFKRWFDIEWRRESNSIMNLVFPTGTRAAYAATDEGRALCEMLLAFDQLLIDQDVLPPLAGQYLMKRRG
jgi:SAM-dependent methyltransferase